MASTAFSSSAEDVIQRSLDVVLDDPSLSTVEDIARLEEQFEVEWTAAEISLRGYKQVCAVYH